MRQSKKFPKFSPSREVKACLLVVFIFFCFLVQTQISFFGIPLNLTLAAVYIFGLKNLPRQTIGSGYMGIGPELKTTLLGASVGLAEDIISGSIIGPAFFSKGMIGLASVIIFNDVLFRWTPFWGGIVIAIFTVVDGAVITVMKMVFGSLHINPVNLLLHLLVQAAVNIPFGMIFKPKKFI
jgi:hypothetical protein